MQPKASLPEMLVGSQFLISVLPALAGFVVEDLTEAAAFHSVSFLPSLRIDSSLRDVKLFRFTLRMPPE